MAHGPLVSYISALLEVRVSFTKIGPVCFDGLRLYDLRLLLFPYTLALHLLVVNLTMMSRDLRLGLYFPTLCDLDISLIDIFFSIFFEYQVNNDI